MYLEGGCYPPFNNKKKRELLFFECWFNNWREFCVRIGYPTWILEFGRKFLEQSHRVFA